MLHHVALGAALKPWEAYRSFWAIGGAAAGRGVVSGLVLRRRIRLFNQIQLATKFVFDGNVSVGVYHGGVFVAGRL